jgi:transcription initiation factor IIE alpha subunit
MGSSSVTSRFGPHRIYAFTITLSGFHEFATIAVPNFDHVVLQVAAVLVRQEHMTGQTIATALGQPLRIVEHILELLESRSLIQISRQLGGDYLTVWNVSVRLRRTVAGDM